MIMYKRVLYLLKKNKELCLYVVFGVLTTAVNYISYYLFTRVFQIGVGPSNILAWILAVLFAYATNRKWVFESRAKNIQTVVKELFLFVAARLFSGLVDTVLMVVAVDYLQVNDMLAKLAINIIVMLLNYISSKLLVFRKKDV